MPILGRYEPNPAVQVLPTGDQSAYIFVTNMNFHFHLSENIRPHGILAYGFGISDFGKPGTYMLREIYRRKQFHSDAHRVLESFREYPKIPSTLDGTLPSEAFGTSSREINIGETYVFDEIGEATITTATVDETGGVAYYGTSTGKLISRPMTAAELADYKKHRDTYFGVFYEQGRKTDSVYEFYERMVEIHLKHPEESILKKMSSFPYFDSLKALSHEERVLIYCEHIAASVDRKPSK